MTEKEVKPNPSPSSIPIDDPRYPIWGRLYLCKIPRIAHYSTAYLERFGLHTSGHQSVDVELMKQDQSVYITINQMVEYYHQNTRVTIVKRNDVRLVYEACQDYTFTYAERLDRSVFASNFPVQDLVKIDEFAEAVYQHAGHEYGEEFARTFLPEGYMKEVRSLHQMFDAVDQRLKDRKKEAKTDTMTVYDRLLSNRKDKDDITVRTDIERERLPDRPSVKGLLMDFMKGR